MCAHIIKPPVMKSLALSLILAMAWTVAGLGPVAQADPGKKPPREKGTYYTLHVGGATVTDSSIEDSAGAGSADIDFQPAGALRAALGRKWRDSFRWEVEANFTGSDVEAISVDTAFGSFSSGDLTGNVRLFGFHLNGFYDYKNSTSFTPFLGAGIGYSRVSLDDVALGGTEVADDGANAASFNVTAGVNYHWVGRLSLDFSYRLFGTINDPEFTDASGADFEADYLAHQFFLGLRYSF